jgi:hypothetical protein
MCYLILVLHMNLNRSPTPCITPLYSVKMWLGSARWGHNRTKCYPTYFWPKALGFLICVAMPRKLMVYVSSYVHLALIRSGFYCFYNVLSLWIVVATVWTTDFNWKRTTTHVVLAIWQVRRKAIYDGIFQSPSSTNTVVLPPFHMN